MYELKKNRKIFTSKFVGTGHLSYEKRIYRDADSQRLRHTALGPSNIAVLDKCSVSRAFHYMSVGLLFYSILKRNHLRFLPHSTVTLTVT